ncbi:hypothetical protein [Streptomyces sp. NPDC097619]|uniref:hypothetical protein n=1 Tax=Streptomyces sp. NPDC097619 TaxID=3157228 RepID=UPI003331D2D4
MYGGNANAYEYVNGDPINRYDLDGKWGWFKKKWNSFKKSSVGRHIRRHRRFYGWAAAAGIGVLGAACIAATAGICAGAGGLIIGAAIGAGGGMANYRIGTARRTRGGYARSGAYGAAAAFFPGSWARMRQVGTPQSARRWMDSFRREKSYGQRRAKVNQHWGFATR